MTNTPKTEALEGVREPVLLAKKHTGMRVDYSGLLKSCQHSLKARGDTSNAEMLRQLQGHLQELGQRWYAGDVAVVDEVLQLYCIEKDARAALAATPAAPRSAAPGWGEIPAISPEGWEPSALPFRAVVQRVQKLGRVDDHHLVVQGVTTVADCGAAGSRYSPQHKQWALAIAALLNKATSLPPPVTPSEGGKQ